MLALGIYISPPYVYAAILEKKSQKISIHSLKKFLLNSEDVKQLYNFQGPIVTSINSMTRTIEFPFISQKKIEQGLPFKIEGLTLSNVQNLVYGYQTKIQETKSEVTIYLTHKEDLTEHLAHCNFSESQDIVTATPKALLNFANYLYPDLESAFLIHLEMDQWTAVHIEKGKVIQSFIIDGGIESLLQSLWEDRKTKIFKEELETVAKKLNVQRLYRNNLKNREFGKEAPQNSYAEQAIIAGELSANEHTNFETRPTLSKPDSSSDFGIESDEHFFKNIHTLRNKLWQVLLKFQEEAPDVKNVLFTGKVDSFENLCPYLIEGIQLSLYEPKLPIANEYLLHAISIGASLEAFEKKPVQFLTGDFTPAKTWRKLGILGSSFILTSILLSATISFFGFQKFQKEKQEMAHSLQTIFCPSQKNSDDLDSQIQETILEIQQYEKTPYFLTIAPTVSEVLTWFSNNPISKEAIEQKDPLRFINFSYELVSYPKIGMTNEPYLVKIDLEFQVHSPMTARKFHEYLLQGKDPLIQTNEEISWESLSHSYRTTFYLKNRPAYDIQF